MSIFFNTMPELSVDRPEERISGYDWREEELYGYEEGYYIDGEFVRKEDLEAWAEAKSGLTTAEEVFG
ncbi:hypothetical protein [Atopococcus tabaci]|uniref:hypothetical protein n=1 Tax=Atopococcus tabaci TaxID=269774 RepID=UPI00240A905F|nr:hypothetical protein [Atopococcus tabaci]